MNEKEGGLADCATGRQRASWLAVVQDLKRMSCLPVCLYVQTEVQKQSRCQFLLVFDEISVLVNKCCLGIAGSRQPRQRRKRSSENEQDIRLTGGRSRKDSHSVNESQLSTPLFVAVVRVFSWTITHFTHDEQERSMLRRPDEETVLKNVLWIAVYLLNRRQSRVQGSGQSKKQTESVHGQRVFATKPFRCIDTSSFYFFTIYYSGSLA